MKTWAITLVLMTPGLSLGQDETVRAAVSKALPGIWRGATNYPTKRQCFSCHHQAMPLLTLAAARTRGFEVEAEKLKYIVEFSLKSFLKKEQISKGQGIGGANTTVGYALASLEAVDHPSDETTAALVQFLLARQGKDGAWPPTMKRPPSEGSAFTSTALALGALRKYGAEKDAKVNEARKKGLAWLLENSPQNTEDRVFQLRGLLAGNADAKSIRAAQLVLLKEQRPDGSWSQVPEMDGDAYATGSALVALHQAGLATEDPAYRKGMQFLLGSQKEDGSWLVETRSRPIQVFFDNGDPGGKSQFISFVASNWATLALLQSLPEMKGSK